MVHLVNNSHLKAQLPEPSIDQQEYSQLLTEQIHYKITQNNNWLSFRDYMNHALYHPQYGYYTAGSTKFGAAGDFITAPELGPLFAYGIAKQLSKILADNKQFDILEFGAGSGVLALNLLLELDKLKSVPNNYYILDISGDLSDRQQETIKKLPAHLSNKIQWLTTLPEDNTFTGVILANEVVDAMPINLFEISDNNIMELGLSLKDDHLIWQPKKPDNHLINYIDDTIIPVIKSHLNESSHIDTYISEVNFLAKDWLASISQVLACGLVMIIDYGFKRSEYYHQDRNQGTLMCHYRHFAHHDPLLYPGLQDITAHVDFTSLAETAHANSLDVSSFLNQANFLLANGVTEYFNDESIDQKNIFQLKQQLKKLTSPSEMGELFKVLVLTKDLDHTYFVNLSIFDRRYEL